MTVQTHRIYQLETCQREMFGNLVITCVNPGTVLPDSILVEEVNYPVNALTVLDKKKNLVPLRRTQSCNYDIHIPNPEFEKRRASSLMDELLVEIYNSVHNTITDYYSTSGKSQRSSWIEVVDLHQKDVTELKEITRCLKDYIGRTGNSLVRQLKRRDALRRQQQALCDVISKTLNQRLPEQAGMRFNIQPTPGESGFSQWVAAMKMVAQLPGGIPAEFRCRLWLTMADKHLTSRGIEWSQVEKSCFNEWSHPADAELGIQIVKDLHRTGCSLFCGEDGQENQALLKKVLLAYARWNKAVGYCQGFNMLAALILQVTDRNESEALKLMIYLIEGVLPDSYFADSLRGLSVDMAVFRELLRSKLPRLSKHLDLLQNAAKDGSRSYEPPLTNVFTMQWFLTLFCNCLPQPTVLRIWDLIFLEGNEILLRTALAIWQVLAQRIQAVRTADEYYCIMGILTRELLESNLIDANTLVKAVVAIGPLTELTNLREHYLYNITPWGSSGPSPAEKQINLHPKGIPLDIGALKKQYVKLKQRQRQAHVIFTSAISRQPQSASPVVMNHLLVGKRALVPSKRLGPPKGSIPPARQVYPPTTLEWKDTHKATSSSSSSDTELCDDNVESSPEVDEPVNELNQFESGLAADDTNLMTSDNTVERVEVPIRDDNSLRTSPVNVIKITSDSEDESAEFESFLADRVKGFKVGDHEGDSGNVSVVSSCTRRNSELALQIIQENSMILHRIMQCQSRLSPSPPLLSQTDIQVEPERNQTEQNAFTLININRTSPPLMSFNNQMESTRSCSPDQKSVSWIDNRSISPSLLIQVQDTQTEPNRFSPDEGEKMQNVSTWIDSQQQDPDHSQSRYHSILEKSKSLDERYHNLFSTSMLKDKNSSPLLGGLHESKSESPGYPLHSPCSDFFDLLPLGQDSQETLQSFQSDDIKDNRSFQLIQENQDLLKAFSVNKTKGDRESLSKKLFQENVTLLESISCKSDFSLPGETSSMCNVDLLDLDDGKSDLIKLEEQDSAISINTNSLTMQNEPFNTEPENYCDTTSLSPSRLTLELNSCSDSRKSPSPNDYTSSNGLFSNQTLPKSPAAKSPNRLFNPFPVPINSRQSKEVPLKLGLYKK